MTTTEKLAAFAALVTEHKRAYMARNNYGDHQFSSIAATQVKIGKRWARVDVGESGKFMVEMATEEIVGIKAYGVPHLGHRYGTLDQVAEWDWSEYHPQRKEGALA